MVASGRLQAKPFAEERFNKTGVGAEPNEFDLWVNTGMYRDPMQLANHEMNHYTDYIISRNANTTINNNMLKQLENSLNKNINAYTKWFNAIPLLGTTALGANAYFNNNKNE